jgi:aerobic carbon-monoxide dehydrogenase medium subunit
VKSAPFAYHAPAGVDEAVELLGEHGRQARALAGGQSLVPLMHRRLERPAHLVDLNRVAGLDRLEAGAEGLVIGATSRQRAVELSPEVRAGWPLLAEALPHVAHPGVRNRGTVVGSLCHADPSAELPSVALALDGRLAVRDRDGARDVALDSFFIGRWRTALAPQELAVALTLPSTPPRSGSAWLEVARRAGDLPVVGVAAVVTLAAGGRAERVRIVCANVAETPFDAREAAAALAGEQIDEESAAVAGRAVADACAPVHDYQGTSAGRRRLVAVLVRRALLAAAARAEAAG